MSAVLEAREPSARYPEAIQPALVRQFELLTTAKVGVTRLRELILTLAVQGKLVPQCPSEAPASEILARARAAAAEQRRERRKSASSDIEPSEPDQGSPALPLGWEWCRGADLFTVFRGVTYQKADASDSPRDDHLPILRANNIRTTINFDGLVYVPGSLVSDEQLLRSGDFVVCLASGSKNLVGKAAMFTGEKVCSFGAFCGAIRLAVPLPFFSAFLASPIYREAVAEASSGIGINNLKSSTLLGLAIALPPEAEQARIVARVDELMRLCDALEAQGRLEAEQHARLLGVLLGTLTGSSTPEELAANWQRVADHFDLLLDRPEAVDALEQTILQLAVRGLLVQQDPSDERATVLLRGLQSERQRLLREGLIKRDKSMPSVGEKECPYPLPVGWQWERLGNLANFIDYRGMTPTKTAAGVPLITAKNVRQGFINREPREFIAESAFDSWMTRGLPNVGDLLFTTEAPLGNVAAIDIKERFALAQRVICLSLFEPAMSSLLSVFLQSPWMQSALLEQASGVTAQGIKSARLQQMPIPVPPLAEQGRIACRVAQLRHLCADLRQRLAASQTTQSRLAEALMAEVA